MSENNLKHFIAENFEDGQYCLLINLHHENSKILVELKNHIVHLADSEFLEIIMRIFFTGYEPYCVLV